MGVGSDARAVIADLTKLMVLAGVDREAEARAAAAEEVKKKARRAKPPGKPSKAA